MRCWNCRSPTRLISGFTTADGRDPSSTYHVAYYAVRGVLLECTSYLQGADLDLVRQLATRTVQKLRAL